VTELKASDRYVLAAVRLNKAWQSVVAYKLKGIVTRRMAFSWT